MITARLPNDNAAKIAVIAQIITIATFGTTALRETCAKTRGSQPSHAMTKGRRETYSSWALKKDHIETIPAAASSAPNVRPPINCEIAGHPASVFHTPGLVVTLKPASTGSK